MTAEAGLIAARWAHYAAVTGLFGLSVYPLYTGQRPRWGMMAALAFVALVSSAAWLAASATVMTGSHFDWASVLTVIREMSFGHVWVVRMLLALVALMATLGRHDRLMPMVVFSGLLLSSIALTGHTQREEGLLGASHQFADAVHLLAAGLWLGGLMGLLGLPRETDEPAEIAEVLHRFSALGVAAVAAIMLSGLVNSLFLVGWPTQLFSTQYGRLLLIKLALFAGMLTLAGANRQWITPAFSRPGEDAALWLRRLRRHVWSEQMLGVMVLGLVAWLGTLAPAAE